MGSAIVTALQAYLAAHPEVLEALIGEAVQFALAQLKQSNQQAAPASAAPAK